MNIYVGNLSREVTEEDLRQAFVAFGQGASVRIITDEFSGASRGFGFVETLTKEGAKKAMADLNGKEMKGRTLSLMTLALAPKAAEAVDGAPSEQSSGKTDSYWNFA
jgi:hypothetical protein